MRSLGSDGLCSNPSWPASLPYDLTRVHLPLWPQLPNRDAKTVQGGWMSQLGSRWLFKDYGLSTEHLPSMSDTLGCSSSTRK